MARLLRGVGALIVLVIIVVGVPIFAVTLQRVTGLHVIPHRVPSLHEIRHSLTQRDNGQLVAVVLAAGVWICWALFTVSLLPELAGLARHKPARQLPGLGMFQRSAGALVAAIAIGFTIAPLIAGVATAARANATPPPLASSASAAVAPQHAPASTAVQNPAHPDTDTARPLTAPNRAPTYEVQRRDTLWGIAERFLHDPLRYPEISQLNPTLIGPDNEITAGTTLTLPVDARGPGLTHTGPATDDTGEVAVQVEPGDNLFSLEQQVTGDGNNWVQGFAANQGRAEPGGQHFTDPALIKPGWTLDIPIARATVPTTITPPGGSASPTTPSNPTTPPTSPPGNTTSTQPIPTDPAPTPSTPSSAPSGPARPTTPTQAQQTQPQTQSRGSDRSSHSSEDTVAAFAGGGLLLAGVSLTALMIFRRRQFQRRSPGRTIGGSPPDLIRMERAVLTVGSVGVPNVTWLDAALRSLVHSLVDLPGARLPDVIAVQMTDTELTLRLTGAAPIAPAPWHVSEDATRWTIQRSDPLPYAASRRESYFAPFPTLTSIGYTESGEHWMLDLERVGALSLTGDGERCLDLARYLAAELAHNSWSEMLQVSMVGFGQELVAANPDRLTYTEDLPAATAAIAGRLESVHATMRAVSTDVLDGRLHDIVGEQWTPAVLLVAPHLAADATGLDELLATVKRQHARAAIALVLANDPTRTEQTRWQLTVDHNGILTVPALGLQLIAQQLPATEAGPLARMLAWAAVCEDEPIPPAHGDQPWDKYADACGGLIVSAGSTNTAQRPSVEPCDDVESSAPTPPSTQTQSQSQPQILGGIGDVAAVPVLHLADSAPWMTSSILPLSAQTYLDRAATTAEDLKALAPAVDEQIRAEVEQSDPGLDRDYADWFDQSCRRPKVRLLGRPQVWAQGSLPETTPQLALHTEAVVLLSTRTGGLLSSEYATLLWPTEPDVVGKPKVRKSIANLRGWFGRDDQSGEEYLVSSFEGRMARYLCPRALRDAELFRRLRVRAVARGADGLDDLWKALELVDGPPFDGIDIREDEREGGPGGWKWLIDANQRLDFEYQAMIVDTAHTVADRHLGAGEPELAAKAAQVALRAGAYDDVPLLDLVAACLAQEHEAEAEAYVRQLLSNSGVEREEDLQPRTAEVLFRLRRRWRDRAS
jgi:nucleoid-associated protein YgaU